MNELNLTNYLHSEFAESIHVVFDIAIVIALIVASINCYKIVQGDYDE